MRALGHQQRVAVGRLAGDELARDAARRSIVLLNNRDNVLPLQKTGQKIALIGPFVQDRENIEGCWTLFGDKQRYVDLETGVRAAIELLETVGHQRGAPGRFTELAQIFTTADGRALDTILISREFDRDEDERRRAERRRGERGRLHGRRQWRCQAGTQGSGEEGRPGRRCRWRGQ